MWVSSICFSLLCPFWVSFSAMISCLVVFITLICLASSCWISSSLGFSSLLQSVIAVPLFFPRPVRPILWM